jgi:hypothetical protein
MTYVYRGLTGFLFLATFAAVSHQTSFLKFLVDRPENKTPAAADQKTTLTTAVPTAPPRGGKP